MTFSAQYKFFIITSMFCTSISSAKVTIVNEKVGDQLAHQLTCTKRSDISKSPMRGFIKIIINDGRMHQVRHLPISRIVDINVHSYSTYIEFENERMKNGAGWMTTVVKVPTKLMKAEEVLALLDSIASKTTKMENKSQ